MRSAKESRWVAELDRIDRTPVVDLHQQVVLLVERSLDLLPQD